MGAINGILMGVYAVVMNMKVLYPNPRGVQWLGRQGWQGC